MKQNEIFESMKSTMPTELWLKYCHLSFGEMAEIEELQEWRKELIEAEKNWFEAEDA